jgi:hypothetical protein
MCKRGTEFFVFASIKTPELLVGYEAGVQKI